MMITVLLSCLLTLACGAPRAELTTETTQNRDFTERDEFTRTYQLGPGTDVEVSSIRGHVTITNADGATAEVKIIRTARTREDLEYHKIDVQQSGNSLVVRGIQEPDERRGRNVQVDHQVILKLPRSIDLKVNSISGRLKADDVDGEANVNSVSGSVIIGNVSGKLQVRSVSGNLVLGNVGGEARVMSISGNVRLGQVSGLIDVASVSGGLDATIVSLTPQGIQIKSVSGSIELAFKSDVNADFRAESISGGVHIDIPNVTRDIVAKSSDVRARIGAGGTPISIFSVSGSIRLTRS
ncbi:MAG TPA: DUF4097 family beta strand repeat-containing protein [Pyrinomonadaceae bacterium]|nr:DUF4097 family beta strand repeat-containing protein [Pyrinomonadaceae bacterium]